MSVNFVNGYTYGMTLADIYYQEKNTENSAPGENSGSAAASSKERPLAGLKAYGIMQSEEGLSAIKQALSEIEPDSQGRITFSMIVQHRKELEEEFGLAVKGAMKLAGLPDDARFKLAANAGGEMEVQCDDPEMKAKIEKVLADNPALVEEFSYIQALRNMEKAQTGATAATHRLNMQATKAGLQQEAMEIFFNDMFSSGMGYSSLLADFSGDEINYFSGANYMV